MGQTGISGSGSGVGKSRVVGLNLMLYSTDRILTTHAGSLPRPPDLRDMVMAKANGTAVDPSVYDAKLRAAVAESVRLQIDAGIDCVNDGELSKTNFTDYVRWRIEGYETRPWSGPRRLSIIARDETKFAEYFETNPRMRAVGPPSMPVCVAPLRYVGQSDLAKDARHDRTLDAERTLSVGRGIRVRHRRCHARGISGDRRCGLFVAD
jgi:5-methyltetrahydropteroyltriglutamate--homocysteine methyltransferase